PANLNWLLDDTDAHCQRRMLSRDTDLVQAIRFQPVIVIRLPAPNIDHLTPATFVREHESPNRHILAWDNTSSSHNASFWRQTRIREIFIRPLRERCHFIDHHLRPLSIRRINETIGEDGLDGIRSRNLVAFRRYRFNAPALIELELTDRLGDG